MKCASPPWIEALSVSNNYISGESGIPQDH